MLDRTVGATKQKEVWFATRLFDVADCDLVMFRFCPTMLTHAGFKHIDTSQTNIINLARSLEAIWRKFDKSSCRYAIKKAERDGVEIRMDGDVDKTILICKDFQAKKGLVPHGSDIYRIMREHGIIFHTIYEGKVVGVQVYLRDESTMIWWIGASIRLNVGEHLASIIGNGSKLSVWKAIQYAKKEGLSMFDLGGIDEQKYPGVGHFKNSFDGVRVSRFGFRKVYSRKLRLYRRLRNLLA